MSAVSEPRYKDQNWANHLRYGAGGGFDTDQAKLAVLMDCRDELKGIRGELMTLNRLLHYHRFTSMPGTLDAILAAVSKPRRASRPRAKAKSKAKSKAVALGDRADRADRTNGEGRPS